MGGYHATKTAEIVFTAQITAKIRNRSQLVSRMAFIYVQFKAKSHK